MNTLRHPLIVVALAAWPLLGSAQMQSHHHHAPAAQAPAGHDHGQHQGHASPTAAVAGDWIQGEVRKLDVAQQKITLRHAAMPHLDMEAMTMVFHAPASSLAGLKVGDRVRFKAHKEGAKLIIDALEHAH